MLISIWKIPDKPALPDDVSWSAPSSDESREVITTLAPAGQHMRDKIAPETFEKLVLIAIMAAGAEFLRHGFFS